MNFGPFWPQLFPEAWNPAYSFTYSYGKKGEKWIFFNVGPLRYNSWVFTQRGLLACGGGARLDTSTTVNTHYIFSSIIR